MSIFYSPSQRGFYNASLHATMPADVVAVPPATYQALLIAQSAGGQIVPDADGHPVACDPDALLSPAQRQASRLAGLRRQRDRLLASCDHVMLADYPLGKAGRAAWSAYRQALRDLPVTASDQAEINWPVAPAA